MFIDPLIFVTTIEILVKLFGKGEKFKFPDAKLNNPPKIKISKEMLPKPRGSPQ